MKKIKFGIIGCGRIGNRHAEHANYFGELIAVCDIDQKKSNDLADKFNARSYSNIHQLLENEKEKIDVIAICTPNGLHSDHSIKSLNAGFHVLCEKPMGLSVSECAQMIQASEKNNRRLFNVKQNRFNPPIVKVKELISKGTLGKVFNVQLTCFWNRNTDYYFNSWKGTKNLDGGTLFTQFSHFIDLLIWLFGEVELAKGFSDNFNHTKEIEFEDSGVVAIKFISGTIGTINYSVNSFEKNMEGSLTILSEKGTVKIGGQYLNELEYYNIKGVEKIDIPIGGGANNYGTYQGSMSNHDKVYKNLCEVLIDNEKISTSSIEGLQTVNLIEKIYSEIK